MVVCSLCSFCSGSSDVHSFSEIQHIDSRVIEVGIDGFINRNKEINELKKESIIIRDI